LLAYLKVRFSWGVGQRGRRAYRWTSEYKSGQAIKRNAPKGKVPQDKKAMAREMPHLTLDLTAWFGRKRANTTEDSIRQKKRNASRGLVGWSSRKHDCLGQGEKKSLHTREALGDARGKRKRNWEPGKITKKRSTLADEKHRRGSAEKSFSNAMGKRRKKTERKKKKKVRFKEKPRTENPFIGA